MITDEGLYICFGHKSLEYLIWKYLIYPIVYHYLMAWALSLYLDKNHDQGIVYKLVKYY